ncbi:cytochrome c3 family protein [Geobacter sp. AOG2]|uniref:cytochrome c3 family protein n=1 Tax=Geobacter sp. AOG2 TaxID=1566347 RepID=UPI001CC7243B|nr:cytochrome c3 family protein [Geobacter sp. AOG2]GFE59863.1 cytochrome c [Geobacter sp. AOG2]
MQKISQPATLVIAALALAIIAPGTSVATGILNSKHNLSISGPGTIKAVSEERVCVFCHTPHHANPLTPLWSRPTSTAIYDLYQSSTLVAKPGQPSGSARLCLSCHDGTIALGAFYGSSESIPMAGGITSMPTGNPTNLKTDLRDDHPISFAFTNELALQNGQLNPPGSLPHAVRLEEGGMLQCTACHNPHSDTYGKFLVMNNSDSALCKACHSITGWNASIHATAGQGAGCTLCHASHNAGRNERLLKFADEEANCYQCHSATGGAADIATVTNKFYNHPVSATTGVHDPGENPLTASKHVECEDCHNPHQVQTASAAAPAVSGSLVGVKGVSSSGAVLPTAATNEFEICFRCHAENSFYATQTIVRQIQELNTRLDFDTSNPSFHPVVAIGKGGNVPSLRIQYSTSSMIYCCDCHANDDSSQPKGPHGSNYKHILVARYETDIYPLAYSEANYALCFRCHDQNIVLDPAKSAFPAHQQHVVTHQVPCSVCHDPHGVPQARGATVAANSHLINFDLRFVTSGTYDSSARSCTVSCHAANPKYY